MSFQYNISVFFDRCALFRRKDDLRGAKTIKGGCVVDSITERAGRNELKIMVIFRDLTGAVFVMRRLFALAFCVGCSVFFGPLAAEPGSNVPTLGIGDKLKLTFYGRTDISGEFAVQAEGVLAIPLLGSFNAEGKTLGQISDEISKAFIRDREQPSQLVIEVTEWRPIYIMGAVEKPGQYPFKPNLTALQAVAIAGGLFRPTNNGMFLGITRERERVAEVKAQLVRSLAQRIRLKAELANDDLAVAGSQSKSEALTPESAARSDQSQILDWTRKSLNRRLEGKRQEMSLSTNEMDSYKRQLEEIKEQIRLTQTMLAESQSLSDKGLSPRLRIVEIQRIIAGLQGEREQARASLFRAERSRIQASQEIETVALDRKLQAQQELQSLDDKIATLQAELRTAQIVTATLPASTLSPDRGLSDLKIRIVRRDKSFSLSMAQAEQAKLSPGDLLMVELSSGSSRGAVDMQQNDSPTSSLGAPGQ